MAQRFESAAAFRQSLEQRLRTRATECGLAVNALRLKLLIERLLARLFAEANPPWLVKGGYAMELRLRDRARTTKDLDLACRPPGAKSGAADTAFLDSLRELLQESAARDLRDHLLYRIGPASIEIEAAPEGGARFPVVVMLAGREYGRFHVDVGVGPPSTAPPEKLVGDDLLGFAGIAPAEMLLVPREVQFAEKLHAYTRPWDDRENTRTKDLVDLLLLIDLGLTDREMLQRALAQTFADRPGRRPPRTLPPPPESWHDTYATLAEDVGLVQTGLDEAFTRLADFCQGLR